MLFSEPINLGFPVDILGQVQGPVYGSVYRCRPIRAGEAETRIQIADHAVFLGRDVVRAKRTSPAAASDLDCNVHGFKLKFSAEHTAAHDPGLNLEHVRSPRVRAKD